MISSVRGMVLGATGSVALVEVGGVGLAVNVTPQVALSLRHGSEVLLHTALIVRDDDLSLYGFPDRDSLAVFDLLRGVTGVGPKSALGVLAAMSPIEVSSAVHTENDGAFRKVSGIGPKTAKLIVLSLAGKMLVTAAGPSSTDHRATPIGESVLVALVGLGWSERIAAQAVDDALATASTDDATAVPSLLRVALAQLGPRGSGS